MSWLRCRLITSAVTRCWVSGSMIIKISVSAGATHDNQVVFRTFVHVFEIAAVLSRCNLAYAQEELCYSPSCA